MHLLISAAILGIVSSSTIPPNKQVASSPKSNCGAYTHGELFWYKSATACYKFQCNDGRPAFHSYGCLDAMNNCHESGKINYPCFVNDKYFDKCSCRTHRSGLVVQPPCQDPVSQAEYGIGESWVSKQTRRCVKYRCGWDAFEKLENFCTSHDGGCIKPNTDTTYRCVMSGQMKDKCKCHETNGQLKVTAVEFNSHEESMEAGRLVCTDPVTGTRYQEGDRFIRKVAGKCAHYRCSKTHKLPLTTECMDSAKNCQPVGSSGFPCLINGRPEQTCRCERNSMGRLELVSMSCQDPNSHRWWPDSQQWETRTATRCYQRSCEAGYIKQTTKCRGLDNQCYEPGASPFTCTYELKVYSKCRCDQEQVTPVPVNATSTVSTAAP